jgi:hypothetical protein
MRYPDLAGGKYTLPQISCAPHINEVIEIYVHVDAQMSKVESTEADAK